MELESGVLRPELLPRGDSRLPRRRLVIAAAATACGAAIFGAAAFFAPKVGFARAGSGEGPRVRDSVASSPLNVVTYNLFWWCVSDEYGNCPQFANGAGFNQLYTRIKSNEPFDLIGFQECDNVAQVIEGSGLASAFQYFRPPAGNDAAMAWNAGRFQAIEGPGVEYVARDQYGDRVVNWVRLSERATGATMLFANTHGPLNQCDGTAGEQVADNYVNAINLHRRSGDVVVFTGDFNCGSTQGTILKLSSMLSNAAVDESYGGADHIFVSGMPLLSSAYVLGAPSDHQLLKATFALPQPAPAPTPAPSPSPSPSAGCPTSGNGGCCLTCSANHYCPANGGCYTTGQSGCAGGYCPAPTAADAPDGTAGQNATLEFKQLQ